MTNDAPLELSPAKRLWRWVRLVLTLGAIVGLVLFFRENGEALSVFADLDWGWLALTGIAYSGLVGARALSLRVGHYQALPNITLKRWWAVAVVTGTLNHLLPSSAGGAWRAVTLKIHRSVALSDSLAIQLWMLFSMTLVAAAALAFGLSFVEVSGAFKGSLLFLAGVGIFISGVALLLAKRAARIAIEDDTNAPRWKRVLARANAVGIDAPAMIRLLAAAAANLLLGAIAVYAGFAATGIELPLFVALIFGSLLTLSTLLVLTPGNLGIIEGVVGVMASLIGRDVESAVTAMLVVRVMNLASVLVPMPLALGVLKNWKSDEPR